MGIANDLEGFTISLKRDGKVIETGMAENILGEGPIKALRAYVNFCSDKQNDLQVRMMEMAAQNEALTPEVMQEFLRQQTAQKAVDGPGGDVEKTDEYLCNSCSKPVMVGWNACPHCGITL